jgi:PilZ domain
LIQSSSPIDTGTDKRRSTRLVQALPITVTGVDALREPFVERTSTVMVSCHGCKYQSQHYVPRGSAVSVEIPGGVRRGLPRVLPAKVIWVQRPRNAREILHIGLDFDVPGNVWDLPAPPADWFPLPGEPEFVAEEIAIPEEPTPGPSIMAAVTPDELIGTTTTWDESEILVMSNSEPEHESEFAVGLQPTKSVSLASTATVRDLTPAEINPQIQEAIEDAVNSSIALLRESIVEDARNVYQAQREELYAKIRTTVEEALAILPAPKRAKPRKKKQAPE